MYSANDFVLYNPPRLEDLCFSVTYESIMNDLDFAFELQTRRKINKFRHSVLLPDICSSITPAFVVETIKQRFSQLKGMVSVDFRRKFLRQALCDRSMDHLQEEILFDVCLDENFDELELQIPVQMSSQARMNVVNKLCLVPNLQELKIKVGREFEDTSEAQVFIGNNNICCCSVCLSVERALSIACTFTYLQSFTFVGVGVAFTGSPQTLLQSFGQNCHFLEVFHMLDTVLFCEDLLYLVCREPVKLLKGGMDESILERKPENMLPCCETLKDLRVEKVLQGNIRWKRLNVGVFLLRHVPQLQYLDLGKDSSAPGFVVFKILDELEPYLSSSPNSFSLKKIDIPVSWQNEKWVKLCQRQFPKMEEVVLNTCSRSPYYVGSKETELLPQVKKVSIHVESSKCRPDPNAVEHFCSLFGNVENLNVDFVFPDFRILDKLEKLKSLTVSVRDCLNDERTTVQRSFVPSRTYALSEFICPNVCLGPDVAREIVKHSPFLDQIQLQCIHGVELPEMNLSRNLRNFSVMSYDSHYSVDVYIRFVEKHQHLSKVGFPARVGDCDFEAVPKLRKLYDLCGTRDIDLQFIAYSCNRFWEEEERGNDTWFGQLSPQSEDRDDFNAEEELDEDEEDQIEYEENDIEDEENDNEDEDFDYEY